MDKGTFLQQAVECADRAEYLVIEGPSETEQAKVWATLANVYATLAATDRRGPSRVPHEGTAKERGIND